MSEITDNFKKQVVTEGGWKQVGDKWRSPYTNVIHDLAHAFRTEEAMELKSYKAFLEDVKAETGEINCPHDPNERHFEGQIEYAEKRLKKLNETK